MLSETKFIRQILGTYVSSEYKLFYLNMEARAYELESHKFVSLSCVMCTKIINLPGSIMQYYYFVYKC